MAKKNKKAVLLIQTGSPAAPETKQVRQYLKQFLSDPRVMSMPWLLRKFLLHFIILPFRPRRSAHAYQQIWTDKGSPLVTNTYEFSHELAQRLPEHTIFVAMRYSEPSIVNVLREIEQTRAAELIVFPLFPQYASATVGSILEKVYSVMASPNSMIPLRVIPPFFSHSSYTQAVLAHIHDFLQEQDISLDQMRTQYYILITFHGLPLSQIRTSDHSGKCLSHDSCCDDFEDHNPLCYKAQCLYTARQIAQGLNPGSWGVSFQSRLGKGEWLGPYTEEELRQLPGRGHKKLLVIAASFVSDNLETLEELGMRGKEIFLDHGGEKYLLVPQLNAHEAWVNAAARIIQDC